MALGFLSKALIGAGVGGYLGATAFRSKDEQNGQEGAYNGFMRGALFGGAATVLGLGLARTGVFSWLGKKAVLAGNQILKRYTTSVREGYREFTRIGELSPPKAALYSLSRMKIPLIAGGAVLGTLMDRKDRSRGFLVGAGIGLAAGALPAANLVINKMPWAVRDLALPVAATAGAIGVASLLTDTAPAAAASPSPYGGYNYGIPEMESGVITRSNMMSATGDVVLGSHARRHG